MSEINKFGGESGGEVKSGNDKYNFMRTNMREINKFGGDNPGNYNPIKSQGNNSIGEIKSEFKQNKHNDGNRKTEGKKIEGIKALKDHIKEQLSDLKKDIGVFEGTEPNMKMCEYKGLKIKFPGKKIKEIISITSSTGGNLNKIKIAEDKLTFNTTDKSGGKKDIDKQIISNDTVQFDWITPNNKETILSFMVENEDGTIMTIQRKVSLLYTPYDARGNHEIKKQENKTNNTRRKEENKIQVSNIIEFNKVIGLNFVGATPDKRSTQYTGLTMEYSGLRGKKIKNAIITSSTGGKIDNISILENNKIRYDFATPNAGGTMLTVQFEFTNGKYSEPYTKAVTLPNEIYKNIPTQSKNI